MLVNITMKTNDAVDRACQELEEEDREEFAALCDRWFEFGEYVRLVIDTKKKSISVQERNR